MVDDCTAKVKPHIILYLISGNYGRVDRLRINLAFETMICGRVTPDATKNVV